MRKRNPSVRDAKLLTEATWADAVIVLAFERGRLAGASYGKDRETCKGAGRVLDRIVRALEAGKINAEELDTGGLAPAIEQGGEYDR